MPPATRTANDEAIFMSNLFDDLDREVSKNSKKDKSPTETASLGTPNSTRETQPKPVSACNKSLEDADDFSALLEGAEDWNWEDMESDFLTPKKKGKPKSTEVSAQFSRD
jgi:DNA replication ATP-dependent helicase Dna2